MTVPFQKPGMLKGVMQKVNPFKSTSQVPGFSSVLGGVKHWSCFLVKAIILQISRQQVIHLYLHLVSCIIFLTTLSLSGRVPNGAKAGSTPG